MASAIPIRIRIIVDPCGRVLVHEVEKLAPGEGRSFDSKTGRMVGIDPPDSWYRRAHCVTHTIDIEVPAPTMTTPQITYRPEVDRP
jgi:hypothetical protein